MFIYELFDWVKFDFGFFEFTFLLTTSDVIYTLDDKFFNLRHNMEYCRA